MNPNGVHRVDIVTYCFKWPDIHLTLWCSMNQHSRNSLIRISYSTFLSKCNQIWTSFIILNRDWAVPHLTLECLLSTPAVVHCWQLALVNLALVQINQTWELLGCVFSIMPAWFRAFVHSVLRKHDQLQWATQILTAVISPMTMISA